MVHQFRFLIILLYSMVDSLWVLIKVVELAYETKCKLAPLKKLRTYWKNIG